MFTSILLPVDGSDVSDKSIATAIQFARLNQARLVAITVIEPMPMAMAPMGDGSVVLDTANYTLQMQEAARSHIDKVGDAARAAGIVFDGVIATSHVPYEEIVEAAKKFSCDIIIMAPHGYTGLSKLLLGSQTDKVLSHTALPVLVLH